MLVFHLYINSMNNTGIRNGNAIRILIDYIPATFFTVRRNMAIIYVLKNQLMEIADIVVVGFISLPKNLIAYYFIPS